jgi:5-methylcytosine-specific restriction endonuclease McrA
MADRSKIEWTDATLMVDRGGKRVRVYRRKVTNRPGTQERRRMLSLGLKWCRGCQEWRPADLVRRAGICKPCDNAAQRALYASSQKFREYRKASRDKRRRHCDRMTDEQRAAVMELFDGQCAYCCQPATVFDHVLPVVADGPTEQGNMVPACVACNGRKGSRRDFARFLSECQNLHPYTGEYVFTLGVV